MFLFVLCLCWPALAQADRKIGLVIGNDAYSQVPSLDKAVADAESVAVALRAQGFEILTAINADRRNMNRSISDFTGRLEPGDSAFLFFAGHGVEIDGENYLLPTDIVAPESGERDFIKAESIALSGLLDRVRASGARMTIAIVDACRNNPFHTATGRSIGGTRGLGRITAPQGTFVIFSAGAGQLALDELTEDDPARNSVFTRALLPRLAQPGLELRTLMAELRVEVRNMARTVNHQQFPAYYDELLGEFYFADSAAPGVEQVVGPAGDSAPARMAAAPPDTMRQDFELARSIGTVAALTAFLDRYADRSEAFSYQIAEQLVAQKRAATVTENPVPEDAPSAPDIPDRRDIIRQTQLALNAAGCSAGGADGIIGSRTRSAFERFIADTGTDVQGADLGSARALAALRAADGARCKTVVTQTPAEISPGQSAAFDLTGGWQFRASCPLFIKTTGSVRYRRSGPDTFRGSLQDSLGQTATVHATLSGRTLKLVLYWPNLTTYATGTLSPDGNSYTDVSNTGCTATAWRAG
ncbi:caspase family protein [Sedimentitalea sp. JM2-8]|uniref:Caspase family protein n=1 Tax=Sedimentitalea xiamensis TaxID=3050037 RepID=A0ABT7FCN8_9RHOB|nr:caspase family protein [Sedimentitalea xiamensis]